MYDFVANPHIRESDILGPMAIATASGCEGQPFVSANDRLQQLRASRALTTANIVIRATELLIIDDLGLRSLSGDEPVQRRGLLRSGQ